MWIVMMLMGLATAEEPACKPVAAMTGPAPVRFEYMSREKMEEIERESAKLHMRPVDPDRVWPKGGVTFGVWRTSIDDANADKFEVVFESGGRVIDRHQWEYDSADAQHDRPSLPTWANLLMWPVPKKLSAPFQAHLIDSAGGRRFSFAVSAEGCAVNVTE